MDLGLRGKVALVAASSKGLGLGIARELAREGCHVFMGSRDGQALSDAILSLKKETGADVRGAQFDASDSISISAWVEDCVRNFGAVDLVCLNAGGPPAGNFQDFDDSKWRAAFELTLMSAVRMVRSSLPHLKRRGGGSIVAVTSSSVKEPIDHLLLSNVFRSGVVALVKSLSRELAADNIRVNNLIPGRIDTDRVRALDKINAEKSSKPVEEVKSKSESSIPMGRYGTIDEFGRAAAFLLSPAASYITGETLQIDGGLIRTVW
ncbi:MAG: SDR family oxidoreductase [Spirochaetia bacterium]|nr:SDR family oxidoreductase [Spirochaetia bacterium]